MTIVTEIIMCQSDFPINTCTCIAVCYGTCTCTCDICGDTRCFVCLEDKSLQNLARCILYAPIDSEVKRKYQCTSCYWSAKPCTNSNCPKEVGVTTKRCSGCHLDRYCSIECQAAAYPDHVGKCQKIQVKRAA